MHKLHRSQLAPPSCLAEYDHHTQTWDDLHGNCKKQIRSRLLQMQAKPPQDTTVPDETENASPYGLRCAYCEEAIWDGGHIEHFRRKNPHRPDAYPELTFDWSNLFLSCNAQIHCGHYKDRPSAQAYDPKDLIKPDEDDPHEYLHFHSSGEVRVKSGLSQEKAHRAQQTIDVFGLNDGSLQGARRRAIKPYRQRLTENEEWTELLSWSEDDRQAYLQGEIEEARWEPYASTILHFLCHL